MSYPSKLSDAQIQANFKQAAEQYAAFGVNIEQAVDKALSIPISLHCWQGDDVAGFEVKDAGVQGGGIMATGNYPGRARNGDELRQDLEKVIALLPGPHRANIHASYCETGGKIVDRDALLPEHFSNWIAWAKQQKIGLDFNPTYFAHPKANDGFTLSHPDKSIRDFWIQHGIVSRRISEAIGKALGDDVVNNHWLPDGAKDHPADRWTPRERLAEALDAVFDESLGIGPQCVDAVEGKLFGLGMEDYTVGSNDFYANYALSRGKVLCLDMGHFHPTESVADKVSAHLVFHKKLLIHTSRPIRWDSDHVVTLNEEIQLIASEIIRNKFLNRVNIGLDFFDASINRIGAYVVGTRSAKKAFMIALLEPTATLVEYEENGQNFERLALLEELKTKPFGAVWDYYCLKENVPVGIDFIAEIQQYEKEVLEFRD